MLHQQRVTSTSTARKSLPDREVTVSRLETGVSLHGVLVRTFDSSWNQVKKQRRANNKEGFENTFVQNARANTVLWREGGSIKREQEDGPLNVKEIVGGCR